MAEYTCSAFWRNVASPVWYVRYLFPMADNVRGATNDGETGGK